MSLVETDWLENNLNKVKLIDCSWHLPKTARNPHQEYLNQHLPSALFFDLDKNSDENSELPHMLPSSKRWNEIVSGLGIENKEVEHYKDKVKKATKQTRKSKKSKFPTF